MKIKYTIRFTGPEDLPSLWAYTYPDTDISECAMFKMLGKLFYGSSYDSEVRTKHAVDEIFVKSRTMVIIREDLPGIPYLADVGKFDTYWLPDFDKDRQNEVSFDVHLEWNPSKSSSMQLTSCGVPIFAMYNPELSGRVHPSFMDGIYPPEDIHACDLSASTDTLVNDFILALGTSNKTRFFAEAVMADAKRLNPDGTVNELDKPGTDDWDYPIHGHDEDIVVLPSKGKPNKEPDTVEPPPAPPVEPADTGNFDPALLYRAAAISLANLDLTGIIKSQRAIHERDTEKYWKEMTRDRLCPILAEKVMADCDAIVAEVRAGKLESVLKQRRRLGVKDEFPFLVTLRKDVVGDNLLYKIYYVPIVSYFPLDITDAPQAIPV